MMGKMGVWVAYVYNRDPMPASLGKAAAVHWDVPGAISAQ